MRARMIAGMPADVVGSLTGLTQGHFPVHAEARYADDLRRARRAAARPQGPPRAQRREARRVATTSRRSINIYSRRGAPVIAVNDGVVKKVGAATTGSAATSCCRTCTATATRTRTSARSPSATRCRSATTTRRRAATSSAPRARATTLPEADRARRAPAARSAADDSAAARPTALATRIGHPRRRQEGAAVRQPGRASNNRALAEETGQLTRLSSAGTDFEVFRVYFSRVFRLSPDDVQLKPLKKGSKVSAAPSSAASASSTSGPGSKLAPHLNFSIRPAGRGAPRIDPKPILDGWKLLEATAVYRAAGRNPFLGPNSDRPTTGQILLMSKEALARRVLANPHIDVYPCGRVGHPLRPDRPPGAGDARVPRGLGPQARPSPRSSAATASTPPPGNVSEHSSGNAVDIAKINGIPILGHQGAGSITEFTIRRLLALQGAHAARPDHLADGDGRPDATRWPTTPTTSTSASSRCSAPNGKLGRAGAPPAVEQPVGQAGQRGSATSGTRSCAPSPRSTRSRSSAATAPAARTEGRLTARAPAGHGLLAAQLFRFCQFDFSFRLGPADGRYLARGADGDELDVVVLQDAGRAAAPLLRGRRRAEAGPTRTPRSHSPCRCRA